MRNGNEIELGAEGGWWRAGEEGEDCPEDLISKRWGTRKWEDEVSDREARYIARDKPERD